LGIPHRAPTDGHAKHADKASRHRAYRARKRARDETRDETPAAGQTCDETPARLRARLIDASNGNIDPLADISPIRALIAPIRALLHQGCDLEADVVPDRGAHRA
jgi:hypothetical protein